MSLVGLKDPYVHAYQVTFCRLWLVQNDRKYGKRVGKVGVVKVVVLCPLLLIAILHLNGEYDHYVADSLSVKSSQS